MPFKINKRKHIISITIAIAVVLILVGVVGALNGWFGGGASIPSDTFTRGLVGYWNFDEGSGQTAYDASNEGNDGTLGATSGAEASDPTWTSGKEGGGLSFDGTDDYVGIADDFVSDEFSAAMWIKIPADYPAADRYFFSTGQYSSGAGKNGLHLYIDSTKNVKFKVVTDILQSSVGVSITVDTFYYVVFTKSGAIGKLYIDGIEKTSKTDLNTTSNSTLDITKIGLASTRYFPGIIDDVRIYNRALSSEEIRYHYNRGGPVGNWRFDEGTGTTAYDSSGNNNNGTLTNMDNADWVAGKYGTALDFDGTDDYVDVGESTVFDISGTNSITMSAWVKIDAFPSTASKLSCISMIGETGQDSSAFDKGLCLDDNNKAVFYFFDGAQKRTTGATTLSTGTWYHILGQYDGTQGLIYVNGVLDGTLAGSSTYDFTTPQLVFSYYHSGDFDQYFNGIMDDFRIYDYARTAAEIRLDYNAGLSARFGGSPAEDMTRNLVGYWNFDEGSGQTAYDASGEGNDGTLGATSSSEATDPTWTSGKEGGGLSFDGTDDYVGSGSDTSLDIINGITLEAWIKGSSTDFSATKRTTSAYNKYLPQFQVVGSKIYYVFMELDGSNYQIWTAEMNTDGTSWSATKRTTSAYDKWYPQLQVVGSKIYYVWYETDGSSNDQIWTAEMNTDGTSWLATKRTTSAYDKLVPQLQVVGSKIYYVYYEKDSSVIKQIWTAEMNTDGTSWLATKRTTSAYNKYAPQLQVVGSKIYYTYYEKDSSVIRQIWTAEMNTDGTSWSATKRTTSAYDSYAPQLQVVGSKIYYAYYKKDSSVIRQIWTGEIYSNVINKGNAYVLGLQGSNIRGSIGGIVDKLKYDAEAISYTAGAVVEASIDSNWNRITMTYDKVNLKLYVNGILQSTSAFTETIDTNPFELMIGDDWNGSIDEVKIYNRALSVSEIRYQYSREGPISHWKFDEGSGTTAYDSTGNNNNGTLTNMDNTDWVAGKYGTALDFDGNNDYVDTDYNFGNDFDSGVTWTAWVKQTNTGEQYFIHSRTSGSGEAFTLGTRGGAYNDFRFTWTTSSGVVTALSITNRSDTWTHVSGTWDGSNVRIYINGSEENSSSLGGNTSTPTTDILIGIRSDLLGDFEGFIDDVRIYNYARTAAQVRLDYNAGLSARFGGSPAEDMDRGLVGYWNFNEGSGQTAYDSTDNNSDGTLGATSGAEASDPTWTTGKKGGALSFDGSDDYVSINDRFDLINSSNSFWVKTTSSTLSGLFASGDSPNIYMDTDGGVYVWFKDSGGYKRNPASGTLGTINDGAWHFVATTGNSTNSVLYVDGSSNSISCGAYVGSGTVRTTFGNHSDLAYPFNGQIDEVRVYNRALSAAEIRYHYNRGKPIAHWKFDEGSGQVAYDSSGNNNNGTLTNMDNSDWVAGKYGTALDFDGSSDYVAIADDESLRPENITVSAWVYYDNGGDTSYSDMIFDGSEDFANRGYTLYKETDETISFMVAQDSGTKSDTQSVNSIALNTWTFVAGTYDGAKNTVYINGQFENDTDYTSPMTDNLAIRRIGSQVKSFNRDKRYWSGLIDDVRIYNYARTADEIKLDYNAGLGAHFK